ncbi:hypothetical protein ISN45_Aa04g000060 [Arabidopsis thaliana x Arabidopsis arenosa]|uniref:Uncharacterized protein n=1 Tax=Arabidopsis thaliana x Arabidopsis arenosa TaxID=1240361 RepID=A0A8T2A523_9BRAS|nr:hypothetical protein ISN45_Aa04g000060 [Arabidopsis thaliana x Arabidopsis arenosa]
MGSVATLKLSFVRAGEDSSHGSGGWVDESFDAREMEERWNPGVSRSDVVKVLSFFVSYFASVRLHLIRLQASCLCSLVLCYCCCCCSFCLFSYATVFVATAFAKEISANDKEKNQAIEDLEMAVKCGHQPKFLEGEKEQTNGVLRLVHLNYNTCLV